MNRYRKPEVKSKKIKIKELFYSNRFTDSVNMLDYLTGKDFIASLTEGCGGSSSCFSCMSCFLSQTKIAIPYGEAKEIQNFRPGDTIVSYDLYRNKIVNDIVDKLLIHKNYPYDYYVINEKLKVTGNHRLWVNETMWKRADSLQIGDYTLDEKGRKMLVKTIRKLKGPNTVYNLHLKGRHHNYFAENVLVHNSLKK